MSPEERGKQIAAYCCTDMPRLRYWTDMSAGIGLFCFITDAHRYGVWYHGGGTYIMPDLIPWLCLALVFPTVYACARILRGYVRGSAAEVAKGIGLILLMSALIAIDCLKGMIYL